MYLQSQFRSKDPANDHALARRASSDAGGFPFAAHVMLHLQDGADGMQVLLGLGPGRQES